MTIRDDDARFPEAEADFQQRLLAEIAAGKSIQVRVTTATGMTLTAMTHPVLQPDGTYYCELPEILKQPDTVRFAIILEEADDQ